jgi:hypothetical protein
MSDLGISYDEWLSELNKPETREGFTTRDAMRVWKVNINTAREKIRALIETGRVVMISNRDCVSIDGKRHVVPLFAVVKKKA